MTTLSTDPELARCKLLSAKQVAELIGVHPRSVWRMSAAGALPPPIRLADRVVRWRLIDLEQLIDGATT